MKFFPSYKCLLSFDYKNMGDFQVGHHRFYLDAKILKIKKSGRP